LQRIYLKKMYVAGLEQKAGEICMVRRIQCAVAKFNNDAHVKCDCSALNRPTVGDSRGRPTVIRSHSLGSLGKLSDGCARLRAERVTERKPQMG
jgi:hypothetical protein